MLYLSHLHSHEGVFISIPLFRNEDSFSFITDIPFLKPNAIFSIDCYDILDLYKVENRRLLPKTISYLIAMNLQESQREKLFTYLWNDLQELIPQLSFIVEESKRDLFSVLWIGHEFITKTFVVEDNLFHIYHDGFCTSFDIQDEDHRNKWISLQDSLLEEIKIQAEEETEHWVEKLFELWEKEKEAIVDSLSGIW